MKEGKENKMDKLFILIIFSLQTILFLMGHITLKHRTNDLQKGIDKQKECWESVEIQNNKIIKEIEEKAQFEEKALGTLAQNIAVCGYELKGIKEQLADSTTEIKESIKQSTHTIAVTPLKIQI
jgi:flagellar motility protein MotE (MotC chaperone)